MYEIIDHIWFEIKLNWGSNIPLPVPLGQIGIVVVKLVETGQIKMYIGVTPGRDMNKEAKFIAEWGMPFPSTVFNWIMKYKDGIIEGEAKEKDDPYEDLQG
jgi:hypothetical protein